MAPRVNKKPPVKSVRFKDLGVTTPIRTRSRSLAIKLNVDLDVNTKPILKSANVTKPTGETQHSTKKNERRSRIKAVNSNEIDFGNLNDEKKIVSSSKTSKSVKPAVEVKKKSRIKSNDLIKKKKESSSMSKNVKEKLKIVPKTLSKASVKKNNQVPKNCESSKKKKDNVSRKDDENVNPDSDKTSKVSKKQKLAKSDAPQNLKISKGPTNKKKLNEKLKVVQTEFSEINAASDLIAQNDLSNEKLDEYKNNSFNKEQLLPPVDSFVTEPWVSKKENIENFIDCHKSNENIVCKLCEQSLDSGLKLYSGEPEIGVEEVAAITNDSLKLFDESEEAKDSSIEDARAYNKITCFE